ncbi:MAG: hypothetical protein FWF76_00115 [Oscillospiraceae bacterium]|nr:hypothetical protein [Oscillospiraceae bacterium]
MKKRLLAMLIAVSMTLTMVTTIASTPVDDDERWWLVAGGSVSNEWVDENMNPALSSAILSVNSSFLIFLLQPMRWTVGLTPTLRSSQTVLFEPHNDVWYAMLDIVPNTNQTEDKLKISESVFKLWYATFYQSCISVLEDCDCEYCDACDKLIFDGSNITIDERQTYVNAICLCDVDFCRWCFTTNCTSEICVEHLTPTIQTALNILRYLVDLPSDATIPTHDFNQNGVLDIGDALQILRHLVDLPSALD